MDEDEDDDLVIMTMEKLNQGSVASLILPLETALVSPGRNGLKRYTDERRDFIFPTTLRFSDIHPMYIYNVYIPYSPYIRTPVYGHSHHYHHH